LGVDVKGMGLVAMHGKLNELLFEALLAGKRFVLVVDEAQNLDETVLETVRMLSNFETHNAKLLQIVLAGQPRLALKLAQPKLVQLRQRVAVLAHLEPFGPRETGLYIEHRLKVAGYVGEAIFDPAAIGAIARQSDGIPRNINNLCYNSLQLSHSRGQRTVTAEIVQHAARSLDMEALISEPRAAGESVALALTPAVPPAAPSSAPVLAPVPALAPAPAKVVERRIAGKPLQVAVSANPPARAQSFLSYDGGKKKSAPNWGVRSAILAAIVLSGILVLAILGRSESMRSDEPAGFGSSIDSRGISIPADRPLSSSSGSPGSINSSVNYDADPQDTGNGQVLTVAASARQTIKDLSLRYVGHFDSALSEQIRGLNPDLKDPDHLQAGQLVRLPLPSGALKKVNDTAEAGSLAGPDDSFSGSLLARLSALLRPRK
jgi:hypothetical protein